MMRLLPAGLLALTTLGVATAATTGCLVETSCFVAGTPIRTPHGDRRIEDLAVGDLVLAFDHETRTVVTRAIQDLHRARVNEVRILALETETGASITLTASPSHPFWSAEKQAYVALRDVRSGDRLVVLADATLLEARVTSVRAEEHATHDIEVFNISVEAPCSNYFADGVLVHNKEPLVVICEDADVTYGSPVAIGAADSGGNVRQRVVITSKAGPLSLAQARGFAVAAGASRAETPLAVTSTPNGDRRSWTVEVVVPPNNRATLYLDGTLTRADGTSCDLGRTIDLATTPTTATPDAG